ncbi:hypothetical protein ACH4RG_34960 [Streptomyces sp. NPDC021019]
MTWTADSSAGLFPCAGRAYAPAMTTTLNPHTARQDQDQDPGWGVTAS